MRLIWTASSYDVACILFIPNNSDDFQSQCGRNEIGQVECYQSILIIAMQRQVHWIYVQLCNHGGVKELLCTPRTIMVEYCDFGSGSRKAYRALGRSALCLFAQKCRAMVENWELLSRHLYRGIQYQV